jgi:DNA repair photolyase
VIISASRRTDIPALYSEWFLKRLETGFAMMPNPRDARRLGRVALSPDVVDCIVFWTKNAASMLDKLRQIEAMGYSFYFQFTLTPYDRSLEANLPPKTELIETFRELANRIGAERVVWRYDPIVLDAVHSARWHFEQFGRLCEKLSPFTRRCVFSFIDPYRKIGSAFRAIDRREMLAVASVFSEIAARYAIELRTCAEEVDLEEYGIHHASCIDRELIEQIVGYKLTSKRDKNQRPACRCVESVDIGAYNTCVNGCAYCYATSGGASARRQGHDPNAPMLTGWPAGSEIVSDRTRPSHREGQLSLFRDG